MGAGRRLAVQQAAQGARAKRRGRSGRREEDGLPLCLLCVLSLSLPLVVSELPLLAELLLLSRVDGPVVAAGGVLGRAVLVHHVDADAVGGQLVSQQLVGRRSVAAQRRPPPHSTTLSLTLPSHSSCATVANARCCFWYMVKRSFACLGLLTSAQMVRQCVPMNSTYDR